MTTIKKVNVKKAIERRSAVLNDVLENMGLLAKINFSMGNSKMGPIPSFSVLPFLTCTNCNECGRYCYAAKNCFNFNINVRNLAENTALLMKNPAFVEHEINKFLNGTTIIYRYFRFNVAGDIAGKVQDNYFPMILRIAKKNPWTTFLLYTKNYKYINDYMQNGGRIPENLVIVFSRWHNTEINNPYNFPVAIVKIDDSTMIPENSTYCDGDCANCLKCYHIKNGENVYFDLH